MKKIILKGVLRDEKKKGIKKQRRKGMIPAVIYGPNRKSTNIYIDMKEFETVYRVADETHMVDFTIDGEAKPTKIIIREVQLPPLGGSPLHVALFEIDMSKKIVVSIPLEFNGESKAVKDNVGILITPVSELAIRCLPGDIPDHLDVDISHLDNIGDSVKITDIPLPEGVEWESNLVVTNNVADIIPPQKEVVEEVKPVEEGTEVAVEGEKKEGEEQVASTEESKPGEKK